MGQSRRGISEAQIREAIDQLQGEGENPSPAKIRRILGSGSYSTIGVVLAQWRKEQQRARENSIPETPASIKRLTRELWTLASRAAEESHEAERRGFDSERQEWNTEKTELAAQIDVLDDTMEDLRSQIAERDKALTESRSRVTDLETELAIGRGQIEKLEEQLAQFHVERRDESRKLQRLKRRSSQPAT